jgi:hypothetical protein
MMIAPSGARNVSFGLGMDKTTINSLTIQSLRVNRDATNSSVTVSRSIQTLNIGGNVENTNIQAGYQQSLFAATVFPSSSPFTSGGGVFFGDAPPSITNPVVSPDTSLVEPLAQNGGTITGRIAGNIVNSVLSASVDPNPSGIGATEFSPKRAAIFPFGAAQNLYLPRGAINLKFEGTVDNSTNPLLANGAPVNAAFFANSVHIKKGPVIPPNVPYQPFVAPTVYHVGQSTLKGTFKVDHIPSDLRILRRSQRAAEQGSKK